MRKISFSGQTMDAQGAYRRGGAKNPGALLILFALGCSLLLAAGCSSHDSENMTSYSGGNAKGKSDHRLSGAATGTAVSAGAQ